jgi:hypothetical protein
MQLNYTAITKEPLCLKIRVAYLGCLIQLSHFMFLTLNLPMTTIVALSHLMLLNGN